MNFNSNRQKNDLTRKMWKTLYESFKQMNMGLCELHSKNQESDRNIGFSIAEFGFVIIRSNSSNTRVIIFKVIRPKSPGFHGKTYILPPYWIRHHKI